MSKEKDLEFNPPLSEIMIVDKAIREIKKIDMDELYSEIKAKMDAADKEKCTGNCGMNYCDDNGCIERKRHLVGIDPIDPIDEILKYNSHSQDVEYPSHNLQQTQAGLPMNDDLMIKEIMDINRMRDSIASINIAWQTMAKKAFNMRKPKHKS